MAIKKSLLRFIQLLFIYLYFISCEQKITVKIDLTSTSSFSLSTMINNKFKPDEIFLNGEKKSLSSTQFSLKKGENVIILKWKQLGNSCDRMFNSCSKIKEIDLSEFNTSQVTSMSHMFSGCTSLSTIIIKELDASKVKSMEYMFSSCSNLESLNLNDLKISAVTNMAHMFDNCQKLKSLTVSNNFNTNQVKNMEYMFYFCSAMASSNFFSKFDTSKVTSMEYMFSNSGITSFSLKNSISNLKTMSHMFYNCKSLESVTLEV